MLIYCYYNYNYGNFQISTFSINNSNLFCTECAIKVLGILCYSFVSISYSIIILRWVQKFVFSVINLKRVQVSLFEKYYVNSATKSTY